MTILIIDKRITNPDAKLFLSSRDQKICLLVLRPDDGPGCDDNPFFHHGKRRTGKEMLLRYLHSVRRALGDTEHCGISTEYPMKFLAVSGIGISFTVQVGSLTHSVIATRDRDALLKGATQQWHMDVALTRVWPEMKRILPLKSSGAPPVPRPLTILPATGPDMPVGLLLEHIQPLAEWHRRQLVERHFGSDILKQLLRIPHWGSAIISVHLGEMCPDECKWDFRSKHQIVLPAYFDALILEAPYKLRRWAAKMGSTLAVLHWRCGLDAAGVSWCIGQGLSARCTKPRLYVTGALCCQAFEHSIDGVVKQLAPAVLSSPHWPRPRTAPSFRNQDGGGIVGAVWETFRTTYMEASKILVSVQDQALPAVFITQLEVSWAAAPSLEIDRLVERLKGLGLGA